MSVNIPHLHIEMLDILQKTNNFRLITTENVIFIYTVIWKLNGHLGGNFDHLWTSIIVMLMLLLILCLFTNQHHSYSEIYRSYKCSPSWCVKKVVKIVNYLSKVCTRANIVGQFEKIVFIQVNEITELISDDLRYVVFKTQTRLILYSIYKKNCGTISY